MDGKPPEAAPSFALGAVRERSCLSRSAAYGDADHSGSPKFAFWSGKLGRKKLRKPAHKLEKGRLTEEKSTSSEERSPLGRPRCILLHFYCTSA